MDEWTNIKKEFPPVEVPIMVKFNKDIPSFSIVRGISLRAIILYKEGLGNVVQIEYEDDIYFRLLDDISDWKEIENRIESRFEILDL